MNKNTNLWEKLIPSLANIFFTFFLSLPFFWIYGPSLVWKISWISIFFLYNLILELIFNRCLGMMIARTIYEKPRAWWQKIVYVVLYSASFSTLVFSIWFPFDLLLINLLLLQLPSILITGTTFHGYLSGKIKTVKIT